MKKKTLSVAAAALAAVMLTTGWGANLSGLWSDRIFCGIVCCRLL